MSLDENYDFKVSEAKWRAFWEKEELYKFNSQGVGEVFSVDTPPPYVSAAHLHVGHAMSYTQAEFVVRYARMSGKRIFYPMGFDDNGLPTERFVEKKYNINKSKITKKEFVELCIKETEEGGKTYRALFDALGISVDWSLLYTTSGKHAERIAQRSFIDLYQKGLIQRKEEPTAWCPFCQTALAQADLDDKEQDTFLNYINFEWADGTPALIATTRPELIPACVALYVNGNDPRYKKYVGTKARVPLFDYEVTVKADDKVSIEFGTGLMMVCTWGDSEDVERWKDDKLETRPVFTKDGRLNELAGAYKGLKIKEAREKIVADLDAAAYVVKREPLKNVCNAHERCGVPSEFIQTPQWFIAIADKKEEWARRGEELAWFPPFMKTKYDDWVRGLKWDWCISRQRYFGVPFPVWHCNACGAVVLPEDTQLPVDPASDALEGLKCACGSTDLKGEQDVMDTWMTSSLTPLINAHWKDGAETNLMDTIYPMSLRIQAFEIIRTWLFYTVVKSHYHTNSLPWKNVMISGWGLDTKGKKMSKSEGNFVEAEKVIEQYSADALRYWSAGANLGQNLRYSEEEVKVGKRTLTKLWNASKLCYEHLKAYAPSACAYETLMPADKWVLYRLQETIKAYHGGFAEYEYARAKDALEKFFWHDLCDNYLEIVKQRLYADNPYNAEEQNAARWTLYTVWNAVIRLYAPFMPFVTEEIYQGYFVAHENVKSVHVARLPEGQTEWKNEVAAEDFESAIAVINAVRKYKTDLKVSIKKELAQLVVESPVALDAHYQTIAGVMHIKEIVSGAGTVEVGDGIKVSFIE